MQAAYDLAPVIADVIAAHCRGTSARQVFIRACFLGDRAEAKSMVEGMRAEPWVLRGHQEARLREFLETLPPVTHSVRETRNCPGPIEPTLSLSHESPQAAQLETFI